MKNSFTPAFTSCFAYPLSDSLLPFVCIWIFLNQPADAAKAAYFSSSLKVVISAPERIRQSCTPAETISPMSFLYTSKFKRGSEFFTLESMQIMQSLLQPYQAVIVTYLFRSILV